MTAAISALTGGLAGSLVTLVADLKLAFYDRTEFRLAAGAHRYVDLAHTRKTNGSASFGFDFALIPVRLARFGFGAGTCRVDVFASADNAGSVHKTVSWLWDGTFPGLRVGGIS